MSKVALVTGANQGLGFALVKALASRLDAADTVYLTARSADRGQQAVREISDSRATVRYLLLDVTDQASITRLADKLKSDHGGLDYVASNAAARMYKERPLTEQVRGFIATNNHGSRALFGALKPLLNEHARYVMVASSFGQLRNLPPHLHPLFDTEKLSLDEIEANMDGYVRAVEEGRAAEDGWPEWINVASKIGQVATTRIAAREMAQERPGAGILINAACPGLIDTAASRPWFDDMSKAQTPDQAAVAVVDVLLTPAGATAPSGQLMRFGEPLPWL